MSSSIKVKNLSFEYNRQGKVLEDISFDAESGKLLAIVGPNGAGKSTLINLLAGILKSKTGRIEIDNTTITSYSNKEIAKKIAVVRQEIAPIFDFTVIETVMMARTVYFNTAGFESEEDRKIVQQAMEATDTSQFETRVLRSLSSGERQRVLIARALAQQTPIILLDEPTSFLDIKHQIAIYDLLKKTQIQMGTTIVTVTHDLNLASQYCDFILLLADSSAKQTTPEKKIYYFGKPDQILTKDRIQSVFDTPVIETSTPTKGRYFLPTSKFFR